MTGFGPFSGVDDNPTAALIGLLEQQPKSEAGTHVARAAVTTSCLPVAMTACPGLPAMQLASLINCCFHPLTRPRVPHPANRGAGSGS